MSKYFGTDGFRGEANVTLTVDHAFQVGRFQPSIVSTSELNCRVRDGNGWTLIAKDTDCSELFIQSLFC